MRHKIAAVVLAGGEGRRIGGGKPLLRLGRERLIDHALKCARQWSDCVAVCARSRGQVEPADAPIIIDKPDLPGPMGGLFAALLFAEKSAREMVLTIPADMPFLPSDLADRLHSAIGQSCCAMACSGGHVHPVCGLWRTSALKRVAEYLIGERRSLRGFASMIGCREVEWPSDPFDPFFNINTADELAQAERRAAD